jgi:hypothetical protein
MLTALRGLTLDTAHAIVSTYPSPRALSTAFRHASLQGTPPSLLLHLTCTVRSSGGSKRAIPRGLSKRIHAFFTATDPDELMS